ncbi:hybrid sensor histidine kinase/response regulator [Oscillatoria sp. FACHB-1406]|uniref:hybrid sensor histidine kinase/response regulator n=1 Tax=Oscillatoria sp. FACHB-1406 TaxID=2692846 RepID=UPI001687D225|nr:hybrid sensor histidine kinase/response regulator [Oscillatoria sp. FACHB-1406]MBD2578346.1 response regulator [Oscillatoria sp. FACHB-1406]
MNSNLDSERIHADFLNEAQELLQSIEQELLSLREEKTPAKVHNLMRAAHTLKGSSASVGFHNLSQIAHGLEGIFKSLYNPNLKIDEKLDTLLFQAYECLRLAVTEMTAQVQENDLDVLNRAASTLAEVQLELGEDYNPDAAIPSSVELGFDVVGSIFEVGVKQRLEEVKAILEAGDEIALAQTLHDCNEIFIGLAESLNLPGFGAIAIAIKTALETQPQHILEIGRIALEDLEAAHKAVLAGDRERGGEPSAALEHLAAGIGKADDEASNGELQPFSPNSSETSGDSTLPPVRFPFAGDFEEDETADNDSSEEEPLRDWETEKPKRLERRSENNFINGEVESFEYAENDSLERMFGNFDPALLSEFTPVAENLDTSEFDFADKGRTEDKIEISQTDAPLQVAEEEFDELLLATSDDEPTVIASFAEMTKYQTLLSSEEKSSLLRPQTVRVEIERLERLNFQASELLVNQNRQTDRNERLLAAVQELRSRLSKHAATLGQLQTWGAMVADSSHPHGIPSMEVKASPWGTAEMDFDTLEFDRYSELQVLLQSVSEEMVQIEEVLEVFDLYASQSGQILDKQQRLLEAARDDLTQSRMQQLGEILSRIERVLQQLSLVYHKSVEFKITGERVLVDKAIAQQLYDPLLHLVRNAFAHGIEPPEVRRSLGKSPQGQIDIRAYTRGNHSFIEVCDDGQGIDFERIRERAIERNSVSLEEAAALTQDQLLEFIFEPGFSTARQANDLFGRGVGLDVVRSNLEAIRATLSVSSQWHRGTCFSIRLPLTLSVAKLLVCQVGDLVYALPSDNIEQIVLLQAQRIKRLGDQRMMQWQQPPSPHLQDSTGGVRAVPIHRLADLLAYRAGFIDWSGGNSPQPAQTEAGHDRRMVMLLRTPNGLVGIEVDRVLGEQELAIRPLGNAISPPSYVDGCTILGNSRLALAIDLVELVAIALGQSLPETLEMSAREANGKRDRLALIPDTARLPASSPVPAPASHPLAEIEVTAEEEIDPPLRQLPATHRCILVVDDSITLRQNVKRTLERSNYRVLQAKDGFDALERLHQHPDISLIICDLEMPNMNGLEFLNAYRQNPAACHIPVVILTSRQGEKHRQLALGLGASAYLTKPYLERDLLTTVRKYVQEPA